MNDENNENLKRLEAELNLRLSIDLPLDNLEQEIQYLKRRIQMNKVIPGKKSTPADLSTTGLPAQDIEQVVPLTEKPPVEIVTVQEAVKNKG